MSERQARIRRHGIPGILGALVAVLLLAIAARGAFANAISDENALPGVAPSVWDLPGADKGDASIQGFATDISVNHGQTVHFKIKTDATSYQIDIYRLGWYGGDGARSMGPGVITAALPQTQPADLYDTATGLTDCGNWTESAHWDVPAGAVSGIYLAKLTRDDTQGASHIVFIVRADDINSDLLFQTSDATWQAYNNYGGNSLYVGITSFPNGHAAKVSYNRPFFTRSGGGGGGAQEDWLFNSEYPMIRFLERNGYDVCYTTDVDSDRNGALILNHKVFLSVGHDEYWSAAQRANVEAARNARVHLAFLGGNEVYWKTRYEPSTDGSSTPHRTLVCYKEGTLGENVCGIKCDPTTTWTGLWRDGCSFPLSDGCLPENALSGNISWDGSTGAMLVPDTYKALRFWRNTSVATLGSGLTATLTAGSLGYEWDWDQYPASYPAGRIRMSSTTIGGHTHHLSLYRHASGALVFGAGTVQWAWGLDATHDRAGSPVDVRMQQATVNILADMASQPVTLQSGLVAATASTDTQAPASVIGFPLNGSSVASGSTVTIAGTASDLGGVVGGVEVSVDGGVTWRPATGTSAWTFSWNPSALGTVTIKSRGVDDSGNLEIPGAGETPTNVITVTVTPAGPACPCTIFQPTDTPANSTANDGEPTVGIETGVKFRTTLDGVITGLRFYKGPGTSGTHTAQLWSGDGTTLHRQAVFTSETASGWQEVTFPTPFPVTAAGPTTYVAAVHSSAGYYAYTGAFFATQATVNGPLRALAEGEDGSNAVYLYTTAPAFPVNSFNSTNYWVDVVFNTGGGPDVTPPTVTAVTPINGATGVATTVAPTASFSEALDATTVTTSTVTVTGPGATSVAGAAPYNSATHVVTFLPTSPLAYGTIYTVTLHGGASGPRIKDVAGNALAADLNWTFTTATPPPPPPDEGPGGPILIISSATNPYSRYLVEILRAEGLNLYTATDLSLVNAGVLSAYDVVILGEMSLSSPQVTMLSTWAQAGGTLIAMRPDAQLAGLMGLTIAGGSLSNAYLKVNTTTGSGVGIVDQTIQYHGAADRYALNGATAVATLYSSSTTATGDPAITTRAVGANGGRAVAFTYDLARSVVTTRQGNPAWAGQERDGIAPRRSDDMFYGAAAGDPQPDWVDLTKVAIPQADEQQRLLANLIVQGNLHRKPLPRFWYLPKGKKAAVIMTGDDHGDAGMAPRFEIYRQESPAGCSADDWECVRATGYLYVGTGFTPTQAAFYNSLGFEVALHVNTNCADWDAGSLEAFFASQMAAFGATYPALPPLVTNRTHCIAWSDWSTQPEIELAHGIRFDTNYYYWPANWVQNRPGMFTGSGMPMRFAKLDGSMIDVYQAPTQLTDESGQSYPATMDSLLARATDSRGYYGAFCANMHFDTQNHTGSNAIVASALARGVPVVSAKQMLEWLDGRNGSSFGSLSWSANALSFTVAAASGSRNLQGMVPMASANGLLTSITLGGSPVAFTTQTIKGIAYAFFNAAAGSYVATYAADTTPPAISAVSATPNGDGTASVTWTTDEASDSRVDYGVNQLALSLSASDGALVLSHAVLLSGLSPSTTYYYRVASADVASNSASSPIAPATLSFTTPAPQPGVCALDDAAADFAAGTLAGVQVADLANGEVILAPAVIAEFDVLPPTSAWQSFPWTGGTSTVSGGQVTVDGARYNTEPQSGYGPGRSLEFVATFSGEGFEHVGFGGGDDAVMFNTSPWAMFSTDGGGILQARCWDGGPFLNTTIPGSWLGAPHRFRIDWTASNVDFSIDGALVHSEPVVIASNMRPAISDFNVGGGAVQVDWIRMSDYAASGTFLSRVFDSGTSSLWAAMDWTTALPLPSSTTLTMSASRGDTPTPDGTWTAFATVPSSGSLVGGASRYIQYRAVLATTDPKNTPALQSVQIHCAPAVLSSVAAQVPSGSAGCVSNAHPCVTVPVVFTRTESALARTLNVRVQLASGLKLCDSAVPSNSIRQGAWLTGFTSTFGVVDLGGGAYQINQSVVGSPCGPTTGGAAFSLDVTNVGADGLGTIGVVQVAASNCASGAIAVTPGPVANVSIDRSSPGSIADLVSSQVTTGPPTGGTRPILLAFTVPGDGSTVEIYRAPYGSYPEYDNGPIPGSVPAIPSYPPAAPWTLVSGLSTPGSDSPPTRDFWYYVAFSKDACGNATASNRTGGTLNYRLGDASDGITACAGDNRIDLADISFLGGHYGVTLPAADPLECIDIGPTTDFQVTSRPTTDHRLDFEDLVVMAVGFDQPPGLTAHLRLAAASTNALSLRGVTLPAVGATLDVPIAFEGAGNVQALSVQLDWDHTVLEFAGASGGALLDAQGASSQVLSSRPGNIDIALLGKAQAIRGSGIIATARFRVLDSGDPKLATASVRARDTGNQPVELGQAVTFVPIIPEHTALGLVYPNPVRDGMTVEFALSRESSVRLSLYDLGGRRVRRLLDERLAPGERRLSWDGRGDGGSQLSSGFYVLRMEAGEIVQTRTIRIIR